MMCLKLYKCVALLSYATVVLAWSLFSDCLFSNYSAVAFGSPTQPPIVTQDGKNAEDFSDDDHPGQETPLVGEGESLTHYGPHHSGNAAHNGHFFTQTGDAHHFGWFSSTPSSPGPIVVKYDFRDVGTFTNSITAAQKASAVSAMDAWSDATGGKLTFSQDAGAATSSIINIGTGDLAAYGSTSGVGGVLGLGGGSFSHAIPNHSITGGVAWQDSAETWDTTIGNGNPSGTFDYFTVVAQEIGHALGLGHTTGADIMNGGYSGERTALSAVDVSHITSIYGTSVIPEPASVILLAMGSMFFLARRRRC